MNHTPPPTDVDSADTPTGMKLHMGIAEQGKLYALAGKHKLALQYYRRAMQMSVEANDPEVFFRHYLECVIDSLEQMGAFDEVLAYCDRAILFYNDHPPANPMAVMDLAHVYQRMGAVLVKLGEKQPAIQALEGALQIAASLGKITGKTLPVAQVLLQWLRNNFHIDRQRILAEQTRLQYFTVRKDTVDPAKAVKLPDENLTGF